MRPALPAWLLAAFSVWHLTAITIASVPPPREVSPRTGNAVPTTWPARTMAPLLDTADAQWNRMLQLAWTPLAPLRRVATKYTRAIWLEQRWNMFVEPPDVDRYTHVRYYIRRSGASAGMTGPTWVDRQLIFPARPEDRFRPFNAYYYEEKAHRNGRQRFFRRLTEEQSSAPVDFPRDLLPTLRYYAERFRRQLPAHESMTRAELWVGSAPVPPPSVNKSKAAVAARREILSAYYEGRSSGMVPPARPSHAVGVIEREGDITWILVDFEEWK